MFAFTVIKLYNTSIVQIAQNFQSNFLISYPDFYIMQYGMCLKSLKWIPTKTKHDSYFS